MFEHDCMAARKPRRYGANMTYRTLRQGSWKVAWASCCLARL
jgi:hypothetical protein